MCLKTKGLPWGRPFYLSDSKGVAYSYFGINGLRINLKGKQQVSFRSAEVGKLAYIAEADALPLSFYSWPVWVRIPSAAKAARSWKC
jgi:hypothetical protein